MKEIKEKERARTVYVPPRIEVHETVPGRLMGTSFYGNHGNGVDDDDSNHHSAGDDGFITGAKILGRDFSFSDVWEE